MKSYNLSEFMIIIVLVLRLPTPTPTFLTNRVFIQLYREYLKFFRNFPEKRRSLSLRENCLMILISFVRAPLRENYPFRSGKFFNP